MSENLGAKIINEMLEELFGVKGDLGKRALEEGIVLYATLHNTKQFDGWDMRISIGPPGAFDDAEELMQENGALD